MILVSSVALCINMLSLLNFYLLIVYQNLYIVLLIFVLVALDLVVFNWPAVGLVSLMSAFVLVLIFLVIWVIDDNNEDHTMENGRAPN